MKIVSVFMASLLLFSCAPRVDVNAPLELLWDRSGEKNSELIIFLPGLYDVAEKFKEEQFFHFARQAGIKADMVAASLHLQHLLENVVISRLEQDLFNPAIEQGYKSIWFVGVSLGGLNSLLFYQKHVKELCGVVLLAPYLGDKSITSAIENAGGLNNWQPDRLHNPEDIESKKLIDLRVQHLWQWIKEEKNNSLQQVYLGFGDNDRYKKAHKLFENYLPTKNVTEVKGEHNWKTGQVLWQQQLATKNQSGLLKACN